MQKKENVKEWVGRKTGRGKERRTPVRKKRGEKGRKKKGKRKMEREEDCET